MIQELLEKIKESDVFKEKHISGTHLSHIFIMPPVQSALDKASSVADVPNAEMHAGFYNSENKKIAAFKYLDGVVEYLPEDDVFQKEETDVPKIELTDVKISLSQAYTTFLAVIKEKYQGALPLKLMIILQDLTPFGLIWNITLLRGDFKTLNVKIDAITGEVKENSLASLINK